MPIIIEVRATLGLTESLANDGEIVTPAQAPPCLPLTQLPDSGVKGVSQVGSCGYASLDCQWDDGRNGTVSGLSGELQVHSGCKFKLNPSPLARRALHSLHWQGQAETSDLGFTIVRPLRQGHNNNKIEIDAGMVTLRQTSQALLSTWA